MQKKIYRYERNGIARSAMKNTTTCQKELYPVFHSGMFNNNIINKLMLSVTFQWSDNMDFRIFFIALNLYSLALFA